MKKILFILIILLSSPPVYADTLTAYSSTADGVVGHWLPVGSGWAAVRDAATGQNSVSNVSSTNCSTYISVNGGYESGTTNFTIWRSYYYFDTSALPDNAVISEVLLKFTVTAPYTNYDIYPTHACSGTQGVSLGTNDFGNVGDTTFGNVQVSSTGQKTITFNSTGIAFINKTGETKIALRSHRDINSDSPSTRYGFCSYFTEQTGTANDPKLEITYALPSYTISGTFETDECEGTTEAREYFIVDASSTPHAHYAYGTTESDGTWSEEAEDGTTEYCGFITTSSDMEYSGDWATDTSDGSGDFTLTNANWADGDHIWVIGIDPTKTKKTVSMMMDADASHEVSNTYEHDGVAESGGLIIGYGFGATGANGIVKPVFDFATGDL